MNNQTPFEQAYAILADMPSTTYHCILAAKHARLTAELEALKVSAPEAVAEAQTLFNATH